MTSDGLAKPYSLRTETRPLLVSLLISLSIHGAFIGLLALLAVASLFLTPMRKQVSTELKKAEIEHKNQEAHEIPMVFLDTDPRLATPEPPKDAKYYSARNTVAANPKPLPDTATPKIDGAQSQVPQTTEARDRSKQFPLQPSPPKSPAPVEDKPEVKPTPKPEPKPEQKPPESAPPGDLAMVKIPDKTPPKEPTPPQAEEPRQRPHTLAEAQALGRMVKTDGGVRKASLDASFDAKGSITGEYDERVVAAIRQRWYDLIDRHQLALDRVGKVVVEFHLNANGSVSELQIQKSDVGDLASYLCKAAIQDPSPYDKWPIEMRRMIDSPYRDVTFTFYYETY